jgi:hypothetical protein
MSDDMTLLADYAARGSEQAFTRAALSTGGRAETKFLSLH